MSPVKGEDGIFFGLMGVKQTGQVSNLQDSVDNLRDLAQFKIAAGAAGAGQQPHQHSQSAAVDENDFAQMQHDVGTVAQEVNNVQVQDFGFT
jgi:hypothetical protein